MKNIQPVLIAIAIFLVLAGMVMVRQKKEISLQRNNPKKEAVSAHPLSNQEISISPQAENGSRTFYLTIVEPLDGSTVNTSSVILEGRTSPGAKVVVNDTEVVTSPQGFFSVTIALDEGENIVSVTAFDEDGNFADHDITVIYNPPESGQ